jgi:hypothetical protein
MFRILDVSSVGRRQKVLQPKVDTDLGVCADRRLDVVTLGHKNGVPLAVDVPHHTNRLDRSNDGPVHDHFKAPDPEQVQAEPLTSFWSVLPNSLTGRVT